LFTLSKYTPFKAGMICLLAATLACNTLIPPEGTTSPEDTSSPEDTAVPEATSTPELESSFSDTFDDNSNGWGVFSDSDGGVTVDGGTLNIQILAEDFFFWAYPGTELSEIDMTFEARAIEGSESNISYGALCHLIDNENFYIFNVTADGFYNLGKYVDDEHEEIIDWSESSAINTGTASNTVRVVCDGSQLELYVNGETLISIQDESLSGGTFALQAGTFDEGDAITVAFDNVVISPP
jgi:hypothetical protein